MRIRVTRDFLDAGNGAIRHRVGDVIDVSEERAANIIKACLGESLETAIGGAADSTVQEPVEEAPVEIEAETVETPAVEKLPEESPAEEATVEEAPAEETEADVKPRRKGGRR